MSTRKNYVDGISAMKGLGGVSGRQTHERLEKDISNFRQSMNRGYLRQVTFLREKVNKHPENE